MAFRSVAMKRRATGDLDAIHLNSPRWPLAPTSRSWFRLDFNRGFRHGVAVARGFGGFTKRRFSPPQIVAQRLNKTFLALALVVLGHFVPSPP